MDSLPSVDWFNVYLLWQFLDVPLLSGSKVPTHCLLLVEVPVGRLAVDIEDDIVLFAVDAEDDIVLRSTAVSSTSALQRSTILSRGGPTASVHGYPCRWLICLERC